MCIRIAALLVFALSVPAAAADMPPVRRMLADVRQTLHFMPGSAALDADARARLVNLSEILAGAGRVGVTILATAPGGSDRSGELAESRARAVRIFLVSRRIGGDRISIAIQDGSAHEVRLLAGLPRIP